MSTSDVTYVDRSLFFQVNFGLMVSATAMTIYVSSAYHGIKALIKNRQPVYMLLLLGGLAGLIASMSNVAYYFTYDVDCSFQAYMSLVGNMIVATTSQAISLIAFYRYFNSGITALVAGAIALVGKFVPWAFALSRYPAPQPNLIRLCATLQLPQNWYTVIGYEIALNVFLALLLLWAIRSEARAYSISLLEACKRKGARFFLLLHLLAIIVLCISFIDVAYPTFTQIPYDAYAMISSKCICEALLSITRSDPDLVNGTRCSNGTDPSNAQSNITSRPHSGLQTGADKSYGAYEDDKTRLSDTFHHEVQLNSVA